MILKIIDNIFDIFAFKLYLCNGIDDILVFILSSNPNLQVPDFEGSSLSYSSSSQVVICNASKSMSKNSLAIFSFAYILVSFDVFNEINNTS